MQKYPIEPKRLRRVPAQFSWVDHRLIRQNRLRGVEPCGWALYLFLLSVGDEQGLSYYSDTSICQHLRIARHELVRARSSLLGADLIAWEAPLYQVLDLSEPAAELASVLSASEAPKPAPRACSNSTGPQRSLGANAPAAPASGPQSIADLLQGGAR
jgi:hypothetical protein